MGKKNKTVADTPKPSKSTVNTIQGCIPFTEFSENGIFKTDEGFSKAYGFTDVNFDTAGEDKQEDILVEYEKFLNKFPSNVSLQLVLVGKRYSDASMRENFLLPISRNEGEEKFNEWRSCINNIITQKIEEGHSNIEKKKYVVLTVDVKTYDEALTQFNSLDNEVKSSFQGMNGSECKPLNAYEYASLMYSIYHSCDDIPFEKRTAKYVNHDNKSINLSKKKITENCTTIKNLIAPTRMFVEGKNITFQRVAGKERISRTIMTTDFPTSLDTGFLNDLLSIPCEMVVSLSMKPYSRKKATQQVKIQNNAIKSDVIKANKTASKEGYSSDLISEELLLQREEAKELRNDVIVEGKKLFRVSLFYTLFGETVADLDDFEVQLTNRLGNYSVASTSCISQQLDAFNCSLPLGVNKIGLFSSLTSASCCAFNPYNVQEMMDKKGIFYGINSVSKNIICYSRKRSNLANALAFGQAGSGKSFFIKDEIAQILLNSKDKIFILDPENEYRLVIAPFGGITVDLDLGSDITLNPCDLDLEFENPKAHPLAEKCDFMVGLVESMLGRGRELDARTVNAVHKATEAMYSNYVTEMERRRSEGDTRGLDRSICPTLRDFFEKLTALGTPEALNLSSSIEQFCTGNYSQFARRTNFDASKTRAICFNIQSLPEKMHEVAMKVILAYIWTEMCANQREINEAKKQGIKHDKFIHCYLDEFHLFFKTKSSADAIMAYYKRVRKYGGAMVGITQDVSDLLNNDQGTAMFQNTGFFVIMRQSPLGQQLWQQKILHCSDQMADYLNGKPRGTGLIWNQKALIPFDFSIPDDNSFYKLLSTNPND